MEGNTTMPRQKKDHQQTVGVLMQFWELPYVVQFIRVFKKLLKIKKNFTTESLAKELATDRLKHDFEEEIVKLVAFVSNEEDCDVHNWESIAEDLLEKSGIKFDALKDSTFTELKPEERLRLIKYLVDLVRREKQDELISFQAKNRKSKNLKFQPVGKDKEGNRYWYFDDKKLYRESCKGGITNLNPVCCTLFEWENLISGMKKSSSKIDREFSKFLKESVLPKVKPQLGDAKEAEKDPTDKVHPAKKMKSDGKEKRPRDRSSEDDFPFGLPPPDSLHSPKVVVKKKKKINLDDALNDMMDNKPKLKKFKKIKHPDKNIFIRKASTSVVALERSPIESPVCSPAESPSRSSFRSPSRSPVRSAPSSPIRSLGSPNDSNMSEEGRIEKFMDRSGEETFSDSPRRPPYPDDDPGIDLSIFEPRGKRKCVIEQEERRGNRKDWWEGQDEMGNTSDENRGEDDEGRVSDISDSGPIKKKRRKKNKPVKSLDRLEHELDMSQANKLYVFSTALANKAAHMVQQGRFTSIIQFHRSQSWDTPYLQFQVHCRPFKPAQAKNDGLMPPKPPKPSFPKEPKIQQTKESKPPKEKKVKERNRLASPNALIADDVKVNFASKFKKVLSQKKDQAKKESPSSHSAKATVARALERVPEPLHVDSKLNSDPEPVVKLETTKVKSPSDSNDVKEKFEIEGSLKIHANSIDGLKKSLAEKVGTNLKRPEPVPNDNLPKAVPTQDSEPTPSPGKSEEVDANSASIKNDCSDETADAIDELRRQEGIPIEEDFPSLSRDKLFGTGPESDEGLTPATVSTTKSEQERTATFGGSGTPAISSYPAEVRKRPNYSDGSNSSASPFSKSDNVANCEVRTPPVKMQARESTPPEKIGGDSVTPGTREMDKGPGKPDASKGRDSPKFQENKQRFVDLTQSIRPDNFSYFASANNNVSRTFPPWKENRERPDFAKEPPRISQAQAFEREIAAQSRPGLPGHNVAPFGPQSVLQRGIPDLRSLPENKSRSPRPVDSPAPGSVDKYPKQQNTEAIRSEIPSAIVQSVLTPSSRAIVNEENSIPKPPAMTKDSRSPLMGVADTKKEKKQGFDGRKNAQSNACKIDLTKVDPNEDVDFDPSRIYQKKNLPNERPSLFSCAQKGPGVTDKGPHYFVPGLNQRSLPPSVAADPLLLKQLNPDAESRLVSPGPKALDSPLSHGLPRGGRPGKEGLFIGHQKGPMPALAGAHPGRHSEKELAEKVGSPLLRHDPFSSPFQAQKDAAEVFSGSRSICTSKAGGVPHGIGPFPVKEGESPMKYLKRPVSPHLTHDPLASLFQNHRIPGGSGRPSPPSSSRSSVPLHQQAFSRRENPGFHGGLPGPISPPLQHGHLPGPYYASRESFGKTACRSPMTGSSLFARESTSNPSNSLSRPNAVPSELESSHSSLTREAPRNLNRSPPGVHNHFSSPFMHRETVLNSGQLFARPPNLSHQSLKSPVDVSQSGRKSFSVESLTGSSERSEHGSIPFANGQSPTGLPFHPRLQGHGSHIGPHGHGFLSGYGGLLHSPNVGERFPYPPNMHTAFSARTSFHPYIRSISDYTNR